MTVRTVDLTPRAFTTDANYDYYRSQIDEIRARVVELCGALSNIAEDLESELGSGGQNPLRYDPKEIRALLG